MGQHRAGDVARGLIRGAQTARFWAVPWLRGHAGTEGCGVGGGSPGRGLGLPRTDRAEPRPGAR